MVGAFVRINGFDPQRAIVLEMDDWRAKVMVVDGIRPFVEYTNGGQPGTHYNKIGWVAKSRLFGFRSTRITSVGIVHDSNIAKEPAGVSNV